MAGSGFVDGATDPEFEDLSTSKSILEPFLDRDFDPVDHLNNALPHLPASTPRNGASGRSVRLPELANSLQTLSKRLNAQLSRLSTDLTQMTDEILRAGGRWTYDVEVLSGETHGLSDALAGKLSRNIEAFRIGQHETSTTAHTVEEQRRLRSDGPTSNDEVAHLERLRLLTLVRERLEAVIKIFGEAMKWPLAPSELSMTSSLISVSPPDEGDDVRVREEKGKAFVEDLRTEISRLTEPGSGNDGLKSATARVQALRDLMEVWKGTAEERARKKLVDNAQSLVDDRQRVLEKRIGNGKPAPSTARKLDPQDGGLDSVRPSSEGGYGFLQNLRNLKNDMYLD